MEGQMHEHGPLHTSVPFVTFDEGGWVVGVLVVVVVGVVVVAGVGQQPPPPPGVLHMHALPCVVRPFLCEPKRAASL